MWQTRCISMKLHTNLCNIVFFTVALPLVKILATVFAVVSNNFYKNNFLKKLPTTNSNNFIFTTLKAINLPEIWPEASYLIPENFVLIFFTGGCEGLCAHKKLLFWHICSGCKRWDRMGQQKWIYILWKARNVW